MRYLVSIYLLVQFWGTSCKKEEARMQEPETMMKYYDLKDTVLGLNSPPYIFDANGNGSEDLLFSVSVLFDPVTNTTKKIAEVISIAGTFIPYRNSNIVPVLKNGDKITMALFPKSEGYSWNNAWRGILASKTLNTSNGPWEGNWKDVSHQFIPFGVEASISHLNYGWVEISFNSTTEQIILHRYAISQPTEYDKVITAGR